MTLRVTLAALLLLLAMTGRAGAATVTQEVPFTASDGVRLHAAVGGEGDLRPRPVIVEFSPYAPGCCTQIAGPEFNYVQVHARGTGRSGGQWSATGPRDQADVAEFLRWACDQPWSDGRLAIYGFSASAIVAYNAMDLELPCLKTAVLMAGTADLYRDLLYIGGIPNMAAGAFVLTTIGGLTLASGPARIGDDPTMAMDPAPGFFGLTADYFSHASEDAYWQDRTLQPSRLTVPILADTGFYDPEARGPYEAFKLTRHLGSHLLLMGAHDGFPAGTGGPFPQYRRWFERYLLGVDNGIDREPAVQAWIGKGSRQKLLAGEVVRLEGEDWPLPGTRWRPMYLSNVRSGTAKSLNDGTLSLAPAPVSVKQVYSSATSNPLGSDPQTTSVPANTGAGGYTLGGVLDRFPSSTEMNQLEPQSLTYTSAPLGAPMDSIGPASLHARLASTSPETDIHAVVADVWPDGTAHPVAVGRLRTSYPRTIASRSVVDPVSGETVQPYADFSAKTFATPGVARDYDVEIWPIGNRFGAGHRIRLYLTGTSGYMVPAAPSVNTVTVGGPARSRLVLPSR